MQRRPSAKVKKHKLVRSGLVGALVDADHASCVAGDAAVGEEVGRVGEDEVDGGLGDEGEEFETVAVVEADVV